MPRQRTEKAHGPYRRGKLFRVVETAATGARTTLSFATEAEALEYIAAYNDEAKGRTVSAVIDEYLKHRRATDLRAKSIETLGYRLHGILRDIERDRLLSQLTPALAQKLYDQRCEEVAVDTHRGELNAASAMCAWCVKRGWLPSNPFASVEPVGRKNVRKSKLRIDESRAFLELALAENTEAGLAAAIALLMGLRASEVASIRVRDVDDGASVLWIDEEDGEERLKTTDSERYLEIPLVLRDRIAALCKGRKGSERLFGDRDRHWVYYHVTRLSEAAKVPRVTPHALRRTHAKISAETSPIEHVARALGHGGTQVTKRHYVGKGAEGRRSAETMLKVIEGGRR